MTDKKMTKEEALLKIEELKKYVTDEKTKPSGIKILNQYDEAKIFVSTKTTIKEAVLEALASGADLSGADLSEINLSGIDLSGSNFSEVNLSGSNLSGSNFSETDLNGTDLNGADLSGAELNDARFYGKGGTVKLKKNQVTDFLNALGFQIDSE